MSKARSARRLLKRLAQRAEPDLVLPTPWQVSYDEHPDDGQFYRPAPLSRQSLDAEAISDVLSEHGPDRPATVKPTAR